MIIFANESIKQITMISYLQGELKGLNNRQKGCFTELSNLGLKLKPSYDGSGLFICDTEDVQMNSLCIDYYEKYWGEKEVQKILEKYEMYFEWENPAVASFLDL